MKTIHWYGQRDHRIRTSDGNVLIGTYRAQGQHPCKQIAVKTDGSPTGTMTCINCSRIRLFKSFQSVMQKKDCNPTTKQVPAAPKTKTFTTMTTTELRAKLQEKVRRERNVRTNRKRRKRNKQSRSTSAKNSLHRGDVSRFIRDIQCLAQTGKLDEQKSMWSFLKDVAANMRKQVDT